MAAVDCNICQWCRKLLGIRHDHYRCFVSSTTPTWLWVLNLSCLADFVTMSVESFGQRLGLIICILSIIPFQCHATSQFNIRPVFCDGEPPEGPYGEDGRWGRLEFPSMKHLCSYNGNSQANFGFMVRAIQEIGGPNSLILSISAYPLPIGRQSFSR